MVPQIVVLLFLISHLPEIAESQGQFTVDFPPANILAEGDSCVLPSGARGVCSRIRDCPVVVPGILNRENPRLCSFVKQQPIVCCPRDKVASNRPVTTETNSGNNLNAAAGSNRPRPTQINPVNALGLTSESTDGFPVLTTERIVGPTKSRRACNEYLNVIKRLKNANTDPDCEEFYYDGPGVVGGEPAYPREFPHLAALGYGPDENSIAWRCGGSLISNRYILTAGHCLSTSSTGPVRWARLGDLDLYNTTDDSRPQQFTVVQAVGHPDYKPPSLYNDVALLRLDRDVVFDIYVRPACLNTEEDLLDNVGDAAGWGLVNWAAEAGSSNLQKVALPVQPGEECARNYKSLAGTMRLRNGYDDGSMLCVGDRQGEKDTCKGDSGGPYHRQSTAQYPKCLHFIAGITSFGKTVCGAVNSPSVYTRVSKFVPWIESVVWT